MSKQEFETFKRQLQEGKSVLFIRLKDFIRIASCDRKEFHRPVNVRLIEDSETEIGFDVETMTRSNRTTVVVDAADVQTFMIGGKPFYVK